MTRGCHWNILTILLLCDAQDTPDVREYCNTAIFSVRPWKSVWYGPESGLVTWSQSPVQNPTRVSPKRRRRRRIPARILGRLMWLAWPQKFSSQARKFLKSNPPSEPVVWVEFYVPFSSSRDPERFCKEAAFLGRILPKNSLGRVAWSEKNRSSPPFLVVLLLLS